MAGVRVTSRAGFRTAEKRIDDVTVAALDEIGAVAEGLVKEAMTSATDNRGHVGRVASGSTRQAVVARTPRRTDKGYAQLTEVSAPQDKVAVIIERGRRPGKGVSREGQRKIERWARRKLGQVRAESGRFKSGGRERAEKSRAFLIARAIKRRGIPALHPFRLAAGKLRGGMAQRLFNAAAARVLRGGGK